MLQVSDVTLAFGGVRALSGVGFAVQPGSITAVIGPNGAGKTSLFNTISGFYRAHQRQHPLPWPGHHPHSGAPAGQAGPGAQLSEHCAVPRHDGAGQHQAGPPRPPENQRVRRAVLHGPRPARGGAAAPRDRGTHHRLPRNRPHSPRACLGPVLRPAKARGNGACPGDAAINSDAG